MMMSKVLAIFGWRLWGYFIKVSSIIEEFQSTAVGQNTLFVYQTGKPPLGVF